jgi:signal transduction histidine kinase
VSGATLLAACGWATAVALAAFAVAQRRRLELVARAEHELRGPASVILLVTERMRRDPAGRRHALTLELELERLGAALADLTAAREGRRPHLRPRRAGLRSLARAELAAWAPALRAAGRPVRLDWRAGEAPVLADRGRLGQALGNLVANAAEHGEGPIELNAERDASTVRLELRNGVANEARRRRGRGLRIAETAAEDAGGRLEVDVGEEEAVSLLELPADESDPPRAA